MDFDEQFLSQIAKNIRINLLKMICEAGSGHPAGALGMVEIFTSLYFQILKYKSHNPNWQDRDFLLVSNGHIVPVWYATLAEAGFFDQKELFALRKLGSRLQGHPVYKYRNLHNLPGIENTSGPLAQGLSQAVGLALGLKMDHKQNRVICVMGDGEQQEGQIWEALLFTKKYHLDNLVIIVDRNHIQIDGNTDQVMSMENLQAKYKAFGLNVLEIDGYNFTDIKNAFKKAKKHKGSASIIIAHTKSGKGVSFMEGDYRWHGRKITQKDFDKAMRELCY